MEIATFHAAVLQKYVRMFSDHLLVRDNVKVSALIELHYNISTRILHKTVNMQFPPFRPNVWTKIIVFWPGINSNFILIFNGITKGQGALEGAESRREDLDDERED